MILCKCDIEGCPMPVQEADNPTDERLVEAAQRAWLHNITTGHPVSILTKAVVSAFANSPMVSEVGNENLPT